MKEGEISFQGNFEDARRADPELYQKWQEDITATDESDLSASDVMSGQEESTLEEREKLKKRVKRLKNQGEFSMSQSTFSVEGIEGIQ